MTGPICSITGDPCECAEGTGCASRHAMANALDVALQGLKGVRLAIEEQEKALLLKRGLPGPELRDVWRSLMAQQNALSEIIAGLRQNG